MRKIALARPANRHHSRHPFHPLARVRDKGITSNLTTRTGATGFELAEADGCFTLHIVNRAIFLDRDGTLIEEKEYLHEPDEVVLFPGTGPALKRLQDAGFKLIVVTNQSGIGRGYYTVANLEAVNRRMLELLAPAGVRIEKIYYAPEAPDQPSQGRKPSPHFLIEAREAFGLDLAQSYMIGDKLSDLACGWNAGVKKSILVLTGYGKRTAEKETAELARAQIVENLALAAEWILATDRTARNSAF